MDDLWTEGDWGWEESAHRNYHTSVFSRIANPVILIRGGPDGTIYLVRPEQRLTDIQRWLLQDWRTNNPTEIITLLPKDFDVGTIVLDSDTSLDAVEPTVQSDVEKLTCPINFQGRTRWENIQQLLDHYWFKNPEEVANFIPSFSIQILGKNPSIVRIWPENYHIALFVYWLAEKRTTFKVDTKGYYAGWNYFTHDIAGDAFENQRTKHQIVRDLLFEEGNAIITITWA